MRVVVGQELDERVQDLVHIEGTYRRHLPDSTPSGGSEVPRVSEIARLVALEGALFLDGALGQGSRPQTFVGYRGATVDRPTIRSGRDPRLGPADGLQLGTKVRDQSEVDLLAVEVGSCFGSFSGLLLMELDVVGDVHVQVAQTLFDPAPFPSHELARLLRVHSWKLADDGA